MSENEKVSYSAERLPSKTPDGRDICWVRLYKNVFRLDPMTGIITHASAKSEHAFLYKTDNGFEVPEDSNYLWLGENHDQKIQALQQLAHELNSQATMTDQKKFERFPALEEHELADRWGISVELLRKWKASPYCPFQVVERDGQLKYLLPDVEFFEKGVAGCEIRKRAEDADSLMPVVNWSDIVNYSAKVQEEMGQPTSPHKLSDKA